MRRHSYFLIIYLVVGQLLVLDVASAARISDIQNTKHNFSATVAPAGVNRAAHAQSESQICAFCHTPHGATEFPKAPIWNRKLSGATYVPYTSSSLDATDLGQPGGKSKLCLSCHDGTLALGAVNVLNRVELAKQNQTVDFTGPGIGAGDTIPEGLGSTTGFTRRIGADLTNDHPISFTFDSAQAARDGELYDPVQVSHLSERSQGSAPALPQGEFLPLEDNKVECISCHDPHIRSDIPGENIKFLRVNRFQQQPPADGVFDKDNDIICLGCHDKDGWVGSAHANIAVGDERYDAAAADLREFPRDIRVWQAACLNCHDPHTVQGSRRILREGTDSSLQTDTTTGGKFKQGGDPAIEQVCYACHSNPDIGDPTGIGTARTLQGQGGANFQVPDIKTDFTTMARGMPISSQDQAAGVEVHSIGTGTSIQGDRRGQDFIESPENLGKGNLNNRHAECTDCHNPHRVMKNRLFNADNTIPDPAGTHTHQDGVPHTNLASGVLRGIWGVEPVYGSTAFGSDPVTFEVKRGDPAVGGSTSVSAPYLTREYQICFKCHSNYSYDVPPLLGSFTGGTPPGTNAMTRYTNQAMEYQSPDDHKGEGTSGTPTGAYVGTIACTFADTDSEGSRPTVNGTLDGDGNCSNFVVDNHRSWHPVVKETGRTATPNGTGSIRHADNNDWRPPFNAAVGTQTMYCTDCHGSQTAGDTVVPNGGEDGQVWGPHGSDENFLLKGAWSDQTGENTTNFAALNSPQNHLCFRCHDPRQYARDVPPAQWATTGDVRESGFQQKFGAGGCLPFKLSNLHVGHASIVTNFRCTYCHVAVPHGWKNKVFLANLNDVGLEAPLLPGELPDATGRRQVRNGNPVDPAAGPTAPRYYNGPYYNGSALKVKYFARSGEWVDANCGSTGAPGNGQVGAAKWMIGNNESCANLP
ncbi:MAG: hypothetical protein ACE5EH_07325 [Gammaproteobacteria bacterium]